MLPKAGILVFLILVCGSPEMRAGQNAPTADHQKPSSLSITPTVQILSDTQGKNFRPYLDRTLEKINKQWRNLIPEGAFSKTGLVIIQFAILKNGSVAGMQLQKPSGNVVLDRAAWGGITTAQPFDSLPTEFQGSYLELRIIFRYNLKPEEGNPSAFSVPLGIDYSSQHSAAPIQSEPPSSQGIDVLEPKGPLNYEMKEFLEQRFLVVVERHWLASMPDKARGENGTKGTATVTLTIEKDGTFRSVRVAESSGDAELDRAAEDAVTASAPIPLPPNFSSNYLKLRIKFMYKPSKKP